MRVFVDLVLSIVALVALVVEMTLLMGALFMYFFAKF